MPDDAELLRRYASEGAEDAFREVVRRHINLVYAAALRRTGGDAHRAEDVSQIVFADLARKARALAGHRVLSAWLYAATRNVAIKQMLSEKRRAVREQEAQVIEPANPPPKVDWNQLRPILDRAMDELAERDREAVLLRYFEGRSYREVGEQLLTSEDTARMRVTRALDKLREQLARHGITSTAAALGVVLAARAASDAPSGLADGVSAGALATGGSGGTSAPVAAMATASAGKLGVAAAILALLLALGLVISRQVNPPSPATTIGAGSAAAVASVPVPSSGKPPVAASEWTGPTLPEILAESDEIKGYVLFARYLAQLRAEEFGAAFPLILGIGPAERWDTYYHLFMRRWGQMDPHAALAAVDAAGITAKPFTRVQTFLYQQLLVLRGWAFEDPEAVVAWGLATAGGNLDGPVADPATVEASRRMMSVLSFTLGGFVEAGAFVEAADFIARNAELMRRMAGITGGYAGGYSGGLTDELRARSAQNVIASLSGQMLQAWVRADAGAASRWLDEGFPKNADRSLAVAGLVRGIAIEEPDLAVNLIDALRDPAARGSGAAAFVEVLNGSGRSARALEWLMARTSGDGDPALDQAVFANFSGAGAAPARATDGDLQRQLIGRIGNPVLRTQAAWAYARARLGTNPAEAMRAVHQLVPDAEQWGPTSFAGGSGGSGPAPVTLPQVVLMWAARNYQDAVGYVNAMDSLTPEQRQQLMAEAARTR